MLSASKPKEDSDVRLASFFWGLDRGADVSSWLCGHAAAGAVELYVATNGNDAWSGRLAEANPDRPTDRLRRCSGHGTRLAELKATDTVTVLVRGGIYFLQQPLVLEPQDSGTHERPVVFAAYPGEQPVFSGGRRITGWKKGPGNLWQVELPEVRSGAWYFRQLFVGGSGASRARSPNTGYHRIAGCCPARPSPTPSRSPATSSSSPPAISSLGRN